MKLKFSKGEVKRLRKAKKKQMKGRANTRVTGIGPGPPDRNALLQAPLALAADQAALAQQGHHLVGADLG